MIGDPVTRSLRNRKDAAAAKQVPGEQARSLWASSPPPPETGPHLRGDAELRALARPWLEAQGQGRVLAEVGLEHGRVRTDLLLLGPDVLHGLELKSERDNLARLPAQVRAYSAALDFCTLAVDERHLEQAHAILPNWWGLLVATRRQRLHLLPVRAPEPNPDVEPLSCARLLWRPEVLIELRRAGVRGPLKGPGERLRRQLVALLPGDELRARVRMVLAERQGWM